jgi:diguanylate cyclase (GGDEF)-like protein
MKKILFQIGAIILFVFIVIVLLSLYFYRQLKDNFTDALFIAFLSMITGLFFGTIAGVSYLIFSKRDEIRLTKRGALYAKPYLIKIDKDGVLETINSTCQINIKDISKYHTVYDFDCVRESFDLMKDIMKQRPFTVCFESTASGPKYIRFLPLKSGKKFFLVGENISTQQKNFEFHRNMSLYNSVTEYPNKNYFGIKLQELFDNKKEIKKKNSLVAIDISGFRNINKLFGYKIADETLVVLGKLIDESLLGYKNDVFHLEEDTFIVLFRNTDSEEVENWALNFLEVLTKPIAIEGNQFNIEVNIGIFHLEPEKHLDLTPVSALHYTILALSKAINSKKTNLMVYDLNLCEAFEQDMLLEIDLAKALKNDEFFLNFQPQINILSNKVYGFEALIRWNNPKYLSWAPSKFIEVAEENNLIIEIGRFVFQETLKFAKAIEPNQIQVSCNVSPFQLLHQGFVQELLDLYEEYKLKPQQICLEITENFLIESHLDIFDSLVALRNKGYGIRLDNFGSGYSSMIYLKDFPIDGISIHRDHVRNILIDKYSRQIVLNLISLAKSLDLEVIAEGVENEKQNEFLRENSCNIIQGHLFSQALSKDEAISFLENYNKNL